MKKFNILIVIYTLVFFNVYCYSQETTEEIQVKQIDSLINSKLDFDKVHEVIKINTDDSNSREVGFNPCANDYDYLITLFKNLKINYASCCKGNTNYKAISKILASIYLIIDNPNCKWGVKHWLVFSYYLNDYSNFVKKNNCCK